MWSLQAINQLRSGSQGSTRSTQQMSRVEKASMLLPMTAACPPHIWLVSRPRRPLAGTGLQPAPRDAGACPVPCDRCDGPGSHRLPEGRCLAGVSGCSRCTYARPRRRLDRAAACCRCGHHAGGLAAARLPSACILVYVQAVFYSSRAPIQTLVICLDATRHINLQATLMVAASALDAQLQRESTVSKVLVRVRPGCASCPAPARV